LRWTVLRKVKANKLKILTLYRHKGLICQVTVQYRIMRLLFMNLFFYFFIFFNTNQHKNIFIFFTFYITSIIFYYYSNKKFTTIQIFFTFLYNFLFYFISHRHFLLILTIIIHYSILFIFLPNKPKNFFIGL
jgi:hypothetical protein